jgi:hypothetical protein
VATGGERSRWGNTAVGSGILLLWRLCVQAARPSLRPSLLLPRPWCGNARASAAQWVTRRAAPFTGLHAPCSLGSTPVENCTLPHPLSLLPSAFSGTPASPFLASPLRLHPLRSHLHTSPSTLPHSHYLACIPQVHMAHTTSAGAVCPLKNERSAWLRRSDRLVLRLFRARLSEGRCAAAVAKVFAAA